MGQIVSSAAKPKRCNLNKLSQLGTPAAGEYILVSYDNSMTANGQGNFDRYIMGDGRTAATALELKYLDDSTRPYIVEEVNKAVADIQPIEITGDVTNAPDEEDLTSENQGGTDVLKFKDKAYNSALYSGLGRVYIRKNIVTLEGVGKNVLTQAMVNTANTIYHIQYDYDLNGQTITLPAGCVLEFDGGSLTNGTIVGNGTLIVASSSVFRNVTLNGSYTNEYFDLAWFITSDSDLSLANLVSSCNNCSKKMYIPEGTYTFTTPVVLNGTFDVQSVGTLNYNGIIDAAAITFGSEETASLKRSVEIKLSQKYFPSNYTINSDNTVTCPNNIGVLFYNTYNSHITILEVSNFCYGVKIAAKNNGSCYNTFELYEIRDCYQALTLMSEDGGWVNENLFLNGRLWVTRAFALKGMSRGIVIDSTRNYRNNNNVFVKPCVEGQYIGIDIISGVKNIAFGVRNEGDTISVRSINPDNFVLLYNNDGINDADVSTVISASEIHYYNQKQFLVFDSGVFTYAQDDEGNITLGNIGFANGDKYILSNVDDYGYVYGGNYYVDITRNEATSFMVQVDGSIRLSFNTYDANGNEITAEGDIISGTGNIPFSSTFNQLVAGAAISEPYHFYVKNDNVKIVRVGIRPIGSTPFFLKRFSIYSNKNGSSVNTAEPSPALPSAPIKSSGISFVSNTNTIAYTDNVLVGWELCNGNWVNKLIPRKYVYDFQRYVSDGTNYCIDGLLLRGRTYSSTLTPNSTFSNYSSGFTIVNDAINTPYIALKFFKLHGEREFWIKLDTLTPSEIGTNRPKIIIIGYDANMNQISIDNMTVTTETNVRYWEASGNTTHIKQENNHTIVVSQSGMIKFALTGDIDSIALCAGIGIYKKITLFANCMEPMTEMPLTLPNAPTAQGNSIAFGERVFDVVNHVPYYWDGAWRTIGGAAT